MHKVGLRTLHHMKHTRHIRRLSLPFLAAAALAVATSIDTSHPAVAQTDPPPEDGSTAIALVAERLRADPATLTVVNQVGTSLDGGELRLTSAKVMDRDGELHGVTFDDGGKEVDLDALVADSLSDESGAVRRRRPGARRRVRQCSRRTSGGADLVGGSAGQRPRAATRCGR